MTEAERVREWVNYIRVTERHYEMGALLTVLKNDGEKILLRVLTELGLLRSVDLVKFAAQHDKRKWSGDADQPGV
jgi:hypothetical protein